MKNIDSKTIRTITIIFLIIIILISIYYLNDKGFKKTNLKERLMNLFKSNDKKLEDSENKTTITMESNEVEFEIIDKPEKPKIEKTDYIGVYEGTFNPNGPILTEENSTQFDWKKLLNNLDKINNRKLIKLKGATNYQFYTQTTTRDRLRMDLDQITKQIIPILNSNSYDFSSTNYGDVYVWTDKKNNEEIKYELFLWDKKHFFEIKFLVHVIKFVDNKSVSQYGVKKSPYLFPTYFLGYPAFDQMIPPPDQVIPSMNASNEPNGICTNDPLPIKYLYINRVDIWNSTLVVNYGKNLHENAKMNIEGSNSENKIGGVWDNKLDYLDVKGDKNPIYQKATDYNKWPTLDEEPQWLAQYPAKEPPINKWDDEGIYYYEKGQGSIPKGKDPKYAAGVRWSSMALPTRPNFWPNNYASIPCGENNWLFEGRSQGINNIFWGGGKR